MWGRGGNGVNMHNVIQQFYYISMEILRTVVEGTFHFKNTQNVTKEITSEILSIHSISSSDDDNNNHNNNNKGCITM